MVYYPELMPYFATSNNKRLSLIHIYFVKLHFGLDPFKLLPQNVGYFAYSYIFRHNFSLIIQFFDSYQ